MSLITNLTGTSELEAVNKMLAAIGQAPVTDLVAGQAQTDVATATTFLKDATRGLQTEPWQFNTRFQVPILPTSSGFPWTDEDGTEVDLNIFVPPANLASFTPSQTAAQQLNGFPLDIAIGPGALYDFFPVLFIDRRYNRDGFPLDKFPKLYIDATYYYDFEQIPETARQYITVLAGRRFIQSVLGEADLVGFQREDELIALRALKRDQGDTDSYNMLKNPDVSRVLGFRPRYTGNFVDLRRGR